MVASFVGEAWQYKINLVVNIFPFEMENESSNMNKKEKKKKKKESQIID